MGKKITLGSTLLIAMDSRATRVAGQLPYDNNMLYLPLPDTVECIAARETIEEDKIGMARLKNKETPPGHVNI